MVDHVASIQDGYNSKNREELPFPPSHSMVTRVTEEAQSVVVAACHRQTPSVGSVGHAAGTCKPCAWNWKSSGCGKGGACTFCHMCDEDALRKKRREKLERQKEGKRASRAQMMLHMAE